MDAPGLRPALKGRGERPGGTDMATGRLDGVLEWLQASLLTREADAASDRELLDRFLAARSPDAFEALVCRHGPVVLGVCRRVLGRDHDAEDAFQATFLVLARKAGSIRKHDALGPWLY